MHDDDLRLWWEFLTPTGRVAVPGDTEDAARGGWAKNCDPAFRLVAVARCLGPLLGRRADIVARYA